MRGTRTVTTVAAITVALAGLVAAPAAVGAPAHQPKPVTKVVPQDADRFGVTVTASNVDKEPDGDTSFSVTIADYDNTLQSNDPSAVTGTSRGFSDWNWVNVWIRPSGTGQWTDGGGNWVPAGKFKVPVAYPSPGTWDLQLSLGAWPNEQYSQIVTVTVTQGRADEPYVVEAGVTGHRYMKISGTSAVKKGQLLYLFVQRPGDTVPQYVMWATVGSGGSYLFDHANAGTALATPGDYVVNVASTPGGYPIVGYVTYTDY